MKQNERTEQKAKLSNQVTLYLSDNVLHKVERLALQWGEKPDNVIHEIIESYLTNLHESETFEKGI